MTKSISITGLRYLAVGAVNTLAGLVVIFGVKAYAGVGDVIANVMGYSVGLGLSFILNRSWTFEHNGKPGRTLARFGVVVALSYLLNLGTVLFLIRELGVNSYIAQGVGIVPYTVFGFLANRYFVFSSMDVRGREENSDFLFEDAVDNCLTVNPERRAR